jgi:hypothetical protein
VPDVSWSSGPSARVPTSWLQRALWREWRPERVSAFDRARLLSRDGYGTLVSRFGRGFPVTRAGAGGRVETPGGTISAKTAIITVPVGGLKDERKRGSTDLRWVP